MEVGGRELRPWLQGRAAHRVLMRWIKGCSLSGELMIWEGKQEQEESVKSRAVREALGRGKGRDARGGGGGGGRNKSRAVV